MSKPKHKQKASKTIQPQPEDYDHVLSGVVELLDAARRASARVVNSLMTATYWEVGRRIVEHEQGGQKRAEYGEAVVRRISVDLTRRFGRGFGFAQVAAMRQFHQAFPLPNNFQSAIGESKNPAFIPVPIGQSLIGQFSQRPADRSSPTLERLGHIARAFPLPWTHYGRLLRVRNTLAREFYAREALGKR